MVNPCLTWLRQRHRSSSGTRCGTGSELGDALADGDAREIGQGADVLIHEAQLNAMTRQMSQGLKMQGNARISAIMADTVTYHTEPVEAADLARAAGVKALVLTHLTQAGLPIFTPDAFTKGMDNGGKLDWRLAADGMTIDLPVGSAEVRFGKF